MRLLLLEDDTILGEALRDYLRAEGHAVDWFTRLQQAQWASSEPYDALLVDWQLPDGSGVQWVRTLRDGGVTTPVLVMTARDLLSDRIQGLDSGADDYLVKPFAPEELVARIRAVRRRAAAQGAPRVRCAGLEIDTNNREVFRDGTLVTRAGRVVSKQDLEALVAGFDGHVTGNTLEVHVHNLRRKLGHDVIRTVRGRGYQVAP
jgi:two-component system OmpR family response regulator